MANDKKKKKKKKTAKTPNSGRIAPSDVELGVDEAYGTADLNAMSHAELQIENEQLKADIDAMRQGEAVNVVTPMNPAVHCKAYLVTPRGKLAKSRGLQPRRIEYACDGSEAIRQYACSYVGSGKEAQSTVSGFTYVTEELLDRRPRDEYGRLLFDLPEITVKHNDGVIRGQIELIEAKEVYYLKVNQLVLWPDKRYKHIRDYRPKHATRPLTIAT